MDILSTVGCSVPWRYHDKCGGDILSTVGVFSTVGDIVSTVGSYLEYRGGYHDACGDIMSTVGVFSTLGDTIL